MNRIIHADCVDGLHSLKPGTVALTVTSPPYDSIRDFASFDFETTAQELFRVTMPGGVVVWIVGDQVVDGGETGTSFRHALYFQGLGFRLHPTMVFHPLGLLSQAGNRYGNALQFMFILAKGRPRTANMLCDKLNIGGGRMRQGRQKTKYREPFRHGRCRTKIWGRREAVWRYAVGWYQTTADRYAFEHPALMPEALARDHILSWSKPGDLVLDPFLGAGTTAKIAALLGRRYVGIEIEERFCRLAARRVREAILSMPLQPPTTLPVAAPR